MLHLLGCTRMHNGLDGPDETPCPVRGGKTWRLVGNADASPLSPHHRGDAVVPHYTQNIPAVKYKIAWIRPTRATFHKMKTNRCHPQTGVLISR